MAEAKAAALQVRSPPAKDMNLEIKVKGNKNNTNRNVVK
jgi:hypothetical protein